MTARGVHFAITTTRAESLLAAEDDDALLALVEEIEEEWEAPFVFETDKGWDALHRCLSDGTLDPERGEPPLNKVFFGGKMLNERDDYFVVLVTPDEVKEIAVALRSVTEEWLRVRYFDLEFPDYQEGKSEEDFAYTAGSLEGLPELFAAAADAGRYVIFTVSQ
jgi:Domain of unknown function (DUF1877)